MAIAVIVGTAVVMYPKVDSSDTTETSLFDLCSGLTVDWFSRCGAGAKCRRFRSTILQCVFRFADLQ